MGIEERRKTQETLAWGPEGFRADVTEERIRDLVVVELKTVASNGHDLGGMGEYGKGWNDRGEQVKQIVKEMIDKWQM